MPPSSSSTYELLTGFFSSLNASNRLNGTANLFEYDQFQEAITASFGGSKKERLDEYGGF